MQFVWTDPDDGAWLGTISYWLLLRLVLEQRDRVLYCLCSSPIFLVLSALDNIIVTFVSARDSR